MRPAILPLQDVKLQRFDICLGLRCPSRAFVSRALRLHSARYHRLPLELRQSISSQPKTTKSNLPESHSATPRIAKSDSPNELAEERELPLDPDKWATFQVPPAPQWDFVKPFEKPPSYPLIGNRLTALGLVEDPESIRSQVERIRHHGRPHLTYLIAPEAKRYKRWRGILTDPSRLAFQSNLRRQESKLLKNRLLVEHPAHRDDLELWCALLDYQNRVHGDAGVLNIWQGIYSRKTVRSVRGSLAVGFWTTILGAVLRSGEENLIRGIWVYAEWMLETYKGPWPQLYYQVIKHFLRANQYQEVLRWHLLLARNFKPTRDEFISLLQEFISDPDPANLVALQSLCTMSSQTPLYDALVPFLYRQGKSFLAVKWRTFLVGRGDGPQLAIPARPFIRYMLGYYPLSELHPLEIAAISASNGGVKDEKEGDDLGYAREFINRVQGQTFNVTAKDYNDGLGARWFASTWVSLETAVTAVAALGIEHIGPLSFQSMALREKSAQGVLDCFRLLEQHGLSVTNSGYIRLLVWFAEKGDDELLFQLLRSDFHPDIWDDIQLQERLLQSTAESGDWLAHRLLLSVKLSMVEVLAREAANTLLGAALSQMSRKDVYQILDDMRTRRIGLDSDQANLIFQKLYKDVRIHKFDGESRVTTDFYVGLCRRLASMEIPVPVASWEQLLQSLGRQGMIDELEELSLQIVEFYTSFPLSRPGFMPIHVQDVPDAMKNPLSSVDNLLGVYIPIDTPSTKPNHPLRQIFSDRMVNRIIRWSFFTMLNTSKTTVPLARGLASLDSLAPVDLHYWRGVRLMRMLWGAGVDIKSSTVRKAVMIRLADLFGPSNRFSSAVATARQRDNTFSLSMLKGLADDAWGEELLPPSQKVSREVQNVADNSFKKNIRLKLNKEKRENRSHQVIGD